MSDAKTYAELFQEYREAGFEVVRILTSEARKKYNMKAHVFQEKVNFEFKYLPMNGKHYYMFVFHEQAAIFDEMTNKEGYIRATQKLSS